MAGMKIEVVKVDKNGTVDFSDLKQKVIIMIIIEITITIMCPSYKLMFHTCLKLGICYEKAAID